MDKRLTRTATDTLRSSDLAVLDQLLGCWPGYEMVDDYAAVTRLMEDGLIEPSVDTTEGQEQPVYRITERGALAYGVRQGVRRFERVG